MIRHARALVGRASDSSVLVNRVRPAIAGSIICASGASIVRSLAGARQRTAAGRANEPFERVVSESRLIRAFSSLFTVPAAVRHEARVVRLLDPIVGLDLRDRIRAAASTILAAVATHTVLMGVLGVRVHGLGWATRTALVATSAVALLWPQPFAAAWRNRTSTRDPGRP